MLVSNLSKYSKSFVIAYGSIPHLVCCDHLHVVCLQINLILR